MMDGRGRRVIYLSNCISVDVCVCKMACVVAVVVVVVVVVVVEKK